MATFAGSRQRAAIESSVSAPFYEVEFYSVNLLQGGFPI
jgi:hypothetical protein